MKEPKINTHGLEYDLVRESGYALAMYPVNQMHGEEYSRLMGIYIDACALLRIMQPRDAEQYIKDTWAPVK
jgi:hypothetical protein